MFAYMKSFGLVSGSMFQVSLTNPGDQPWVPWVAKPDVYFLCRHSLRSRYQPEGCLLGRSLWMPFSWVGKVGGLKFGETAPETTTPQFGELYSPQFAGSPTPNTKNMAWIQCLIQYVIC